MQPWRYSWLVAALLLVSLSACAVDGGRGSTGFDISENAAITRVLTTQECVGLGQLTICPADQKQGVTPTPTAVATPTAPVGPTATPASGSSPRIDTGVADGALIACIRPHPDAACVLAFGFTATGFAPDTTFRVASRLSPDSAWHLAAAPVADGTAETPGFESIVAIQLPPDTVEARIQFAVLTFVHAPAESPETFGELADTEADSAFVTHEFLLEVITTEPEPTPTGDTTPLPTPSVDVPTVAPTPLPTLGPPSLGPIITYFGVARADDLPLAPTAFDPEGRPIFVRQVGSGMSLIVEGHPGLSERPLGVWAYTDADRAGDMSIIVSRPLGDGSTTVCDNSPPTIGGVPATSPLVFSDDPAVVAASNDLACRVADGTGQPRGRNASEACTRDRSGEFGFVDTSSTLQFCLPIAGAWSFAAGDTTVAVRLRDDQGEPGAPEEIVVRIAGVGVSTPTPRATATPEVEASPSPPPSSVTMTPTSTPVPADGTPLITHVGLARADNVPLVPIDVDDQQRPIYDIRFGHSVSLVVEGRPGPAGRPIGNSAYSDAEVLGDLQVIVSRALGDGSAIVCDDTPPLIGGIPATVPFAFSDLPGVVAASNDLSCRVDDGAGQPRGRPAARDACTRDRSGEFGFVDIDSTVQFCLPIVSSWPFPLGDTLVAVRLRDVLGALSAPREIVVRVTALGT